MGGPEQRGGRPLKTCMGRKRRVEEESMETFFSRVGRNDAFPTERGRSPFDVRGWGDLHMTKKAPKREEGKIA